MPITLTTKITIDDITNGMICGNSRKFSSNPNAIPPYDAGRAADAITNFFAGNGNDIVYRALGAKGEWRFWNGITWRLYEANDLKADIRLILGPGTTAKLIEETEKTMRLVSQRNWADFDQAGVVTYGKIAIDQNLKARKTEKSDLSTWHMPITPVKSPTPKWDKIVTTLLPDKADQNLLAEIFGACLFPQINIQAFYTWFGPAATGKSTIQAVLRELLGGQMAATKLCDLSEPFGTAGLVGKFVNVDNEASYLSPADEAVLKQITGGDPVRINPKNKDDYPAILPCKIIMVTNELPRISDKTDGLWSRLVILPFNVRPNGGKTTQEVVATLRDEHEGIMFWAYKAVQRVLKRGTRATAHTQSVAAITIKNSHQEDSNPVKEWVELYLEQSPDTIIDKDGAWERYRNWMNYCGRQPGCYGTFFRNLWRVIGEEAETRPNKPVDGKRKRAIKGYTYRPAAIIHPKHRVRPT